MNSGATPLPVKGEKKRKMDNGISSLFDIHSGSSQQACVFNLQVLLFLIDRHWLSIHHSLKLGIVDSLIQFATSDEPLIQNWAFLCLAAVVHGERFLAKAKNSTLPSQSFQSSQLQTAYESTTWDSIWTHSIRRINAPSTCRAASHVAHALIFQVPGGLSVPLPSYRILAEIESLASDLEVQGPSHPYDSVCNFLSQCIKIANQDARLYRMHLEDKVIGWMTDHWKATKLRPTPQTLRDGINLLQAVCGVTRESFLVSRLSIPACSIAAVITKESTEKNVREFLLSAKLPSPSQRTPVRTTDNQIPSVVREINVGVGIAELMPPQTRERKISAIFMRTLESLSDEWENVNENRISMTADIACQTLHCALISLVFESLLVYNGMAANRHLVQASTKLILSVTRSLHGSTWNVAEKASVLHALEPLVLLDEEEAFESSAWETMLPPGTGSGIKKHVFYSLVDKFDALERHAKAQRVNLLRIIWQLPDVRDFISLYLVPVEISSQAEKHLCQVIVTLRKLFSALISSRTLATDNAPGLENDERDSFGPTRITSSSMGFTSQGIPGNDAYLARILEVCMRFLAAGPLLQSVSGEPTKDIYTINTILECGIVNANGFLIGFSLLLAEIKRRTFSLGNNLQRYLDVLDDFFGSYEYEQSERMQQIVSKFLHSILDLWLTNVEVRNQVDALPKWLLKSHRKGRAKYKTERDAFIRFVDKMTLQEPQALEWLLLSENQGLSEDVLLNYLPLQMWNQDNDVRIRFRVAVLNARLFHAIQRLDVYPSKLYTGIREFYDGVEVHQ